MKSWSFFFRVFCRQVDLVVLLSASSQQPLIARYPVLAGKPVRVIPHGHYRDEYEAPPPAEAARTTLGLAEKPRILVWNKADRLEADDADHLASHGGGFVVSALDRATFGPLLLAGNGGQ